MPAIWLQLKHWQRVGGLSHSPSLHCSELKSYRVRKWDMVTILVHVQGPPPSSLLSVSKQLSRKLMCRTVYKVLRLNNLFQYLVQALHHDLVKWRRELNRFIPIVHVLFFPSLFISVLNLKVIFSAQIIWNFFAYAFDFFFSGSPWKCSWDVNSLSNLPSLASLFYSILTCCDSSETEVFKM